MKNGSAQRVPCVCDSQKMNDTSHCAGVATGSWPELLVLECPSRGAAAEAAAKFTFPPGLLCWRQVLQTPRAESTGEHSFDFLAPVLHCLLFQVPIKPEQLLCGPW